MNEELDKRLCAKYPKIFAGRHLSMTVTAMCWGFACDDGWYNIIDRLCANIQGHIDWSRSTRLRDLRFNRALKRALAGDNSRLIAYYSYGGSVTDYTMGFVERDIRAAQLRIVEPAVRQVVAMQVKEKFSTLRFYYEGGDETIRGMVQMAESMSSVTCETCGAPGQRRSSHGWHYTSCDQHAREDDKEIEDYDY
jgi:hypothetical protein